MTWVDGQIESQRNGMNRWMNRWMYDAEHNEKK